MSENRQTRSNVVRRGLVLLGGAIGLGAGAGAAMKATSGGDERTLTLRSPALRLHVPERRPGEAIRAGDRGTLHGELVDASGARIGAFHGARVAIESAVGAGAFADGSMEQHTFQLEGGTLLGMGTFLGAESLFTIVGGTGRYAGARGTYVATQRLRELGGDGTAEFTLNLTP